MISVDIQGIKCFYKKGMWSSDDEWFTNILNESHQDFLENNFGEAIPNYELRAVRYQLNKFGGRILKGKVRKERFNKDTLY